MTFFSGISLYTCRLANALADENDVSVILMRRLLPRRLYPGGSRVGEQLTTATYRDEVPVFDGVDWFVLPSLVRALRFLKQQRPEVLVLQWWTGAVLHSFLVLALAARLRRIPVVLEMHEVQDTGEAAIGWVRRYTEALIRPLLAMTAAFVVHSRVDAEVVAESGWSGRKPVRVIKHGPYDHLAPAVDAPPREPGDDFTYLYFGTIRPYKGVEHLVDAFDSLDSADARLLVVGETWEGHALPAERIAAARHGDRIEFVNRYVHDDEAAGFFARADAVVLPYLRSSASGPLHIAMSHGLPVVLSDVGGLTEAAEGYEGIRFVTPGDVPGIAEALREVRSWPVRRYPDPCSWEATTRHFGELFDELL
ncbi:glycosyltransferase [Nocardioides sp. CBS4Y-1]|uniref:Glycosyltransferase n=2 Tax=Nocardioides acrostichi TaxID=2784339 RepID=A0A930V1C1_9ACTN|nr:glycosyltransferase [Nocardioides acrostichi]